MQTLILGAGGAGCNIVSQLEVEQLATTALFNTDLEALQRHLSSNSYQLGKQLCQGLPPKKFTQAQQAVEESLAEIEALIKPYRTIFLVAGLGGNTGTAFVEQLVKLINPANKKLYLFLITPLAMERERLELAEKVLNQLAAHHQTNIYSLAELSKTAPEKDTFASFLARVDSLIRSEVYKKTSSRR